MFDKEQMIIDFNKLKNGNKDERTKLLNICESIKINILESEHLNFNENQLRNLSNKIHSEILEKLKYFDCFDNGRLRCVIKKIIRNYVTINKKSDETVNDCSCIHYKDIFNWYGYTE